MSKIHQKHGQNWCIFCAPAIYMIHFNNFDQIILTYLYMVDNINDLSLVQIMTILIGLNST